MSDAHMHLLPSTFHPAHRTLLTVFPLKADLNHAGKMNYHIEWHLQDPNLFNGFCCINIAFESQSGFKAFYAQSYTLQPPESLHSKNDCLFYNKRGSLLEPKAMDTA